MPSCSALFHPSTAAALHQPALSRALDDALAVLSPSLTHHAASPASVLLIGPPSSGKSLLTNLLIHALRHRLPRQLLVVHLSGLLHPTPARAWRHLAHSLLEWHHNRSPSSSPSSPHSNGDDDDISHFQASIQPVLADMRSTSTALLLVFDQLHRFATPDPLAQTVLYSTLNLLQDRSLRAACIAQSTYVDVVDSLEKRVLSRFSHRKIVVPLPADVREVRAFIAAALGEPLAEQDASVTDSDSPALRRSSRSSRSAARPRVSKSRDPRPSTAVAAALLRDERFERVVRRRLARSRVMAPMLRAVDAALQADACEERGEQADISQRVDVAVDVVRDALDERDAFADALVSLTELQVALVAALRRLERRSARRGGGGGGCGGGVDVTGGRISLRDVYAEYTTMRREDAGRLADVQGGFCAVDFAKAQRAWELLVESGVVVRGGEGGTRDGRRVFCAVGGSEVDLAVQKHASASTVLKQWARAT